MNHFMYVCMYVCMYVYIYAHVCMHICMYLFVACMHVLCTCTYLPTHNHSISTDISIYIYIYILSTHPYNHNDRSLQEVQGMRRGPPGSVTSIALERLTSNTSAPTQVVHFPL